MTKVTRYGIPLALGAVICWLLSRPPVDKVSRTVHECRILTTAFSRLSIAYGGLPQEWSNECHVSATMLQVLAGVETDPAVTRFNPRRLVFLEWPATSFTDGPRDSMGHPYHLRLLPDISVVTVPASECSVCASADQAPELSR